MGDLNNASKYLKGGCIEDTRCSPECQETLPCCVGHRALTGTGCLERLWGLLVGDLQKLSGRGAGHPALGDFEERVRPDAPRGPSTSALL